jgi:hypothetical protein
MLRSMDPSLAADYDKTRPLILLRGTAVRDARLRLAMGRQSLASYAHLD